MPSAKREKIPAEQLRGKPLLTVTEAGFLFDAANGESYTLNRTGMYVARSLLAGGDSRTLWREVVKQFDVPETAARRDVIQFLAQLRALGLVAVVPPDA